MSMTLKTQGWARGNMRGAVWITRSIPSVVTIGCEIKDLGQPKLQCGLEFTFLPNEIFLHQKCYRCYVVEYRKTHGQYLMKIVPHRLYVKHKKFVFVLIVKCVHNQGHLSAETNAVGGRWTGGITALCS
jgi:hypothetical protein